MNFSVDFIFQYLSILSNVVVYFELLLWFYFIPIFVESQSVFTTEFV